MSCQTLIRMFNNLAVPVYIDPQEIEVGQAVFHNFVHQEFELQNMSDDSIVVNSTDIIDDNLAMANNIMFAHENGTSSVLIRNIGGSIRDLANEFAQSRQRDEIRRHADEVDLGHITFERFWGLLEEVFSHGINVYNIVALFFFCSDILMKSVKEKMLQLGKNLFIWSLKYIAEQVCNWIHKNGGWTSLANRFITKKYFAHLSVAVIACACGWGLYKGLKI